MKFSVKRLLLAISFSATLPLAAVAQSSTFPDGPITWIVNWPEGGGQDTVSRLVADRLSGELGVPINIENIVGGAGLAGLRELAIAKPDGYTIGMLGISSIVQQYTDNQPLQLETLQALASFGTDPVTLAVRSDSSFNTLEDYLAAVSENPGSIRNANDPPAGASYIAATLLEERLQLELNKVSHPGYVAIVEALLAGEVHSVTVPVPQLLTHLKAGNIRILGVMASERHDALPHTPTFAEQGYDLIFGDFRAMMAPAGIHDERATALTNALMTVMTSQQFVKQAADLGYQVDPSDAETASRVLENLDRQIYKALEKSIFADNAGR